MGVCLTNTAALVCSPELAQDYVPVVIGDGDGKDTADVLFDRAVAASGFPKATGIVVALYEDGVHERPHVVVWDSSYGGVWASAHPDSYDVPEWPDVTV